VLRTRFGLIPPFGRNPTTQNVQRIGTKSANFGLGGGLPTPKQEPFAVVLRLADQRQENIPQVGADFANAQDLTPLGEVEHLLR